MSQLYSRVQETASALEARGRSAPELLILYYGGQPEALVEGLSDEGSPGALPHLPDQGRLYGDGKLRLLTGAPCFHDGFSMESIAQLPRAMGLLGLKRLILAGPGTMLAPELEAQALVAVSDHLNLTGDSPLVGPHEPRLGKRFPDMGEAWSPKLRSLVGLSEGVLAGLSGPGQLTPAQLAHLKEMGAQMADWRFLPENQAAVHMGVEVLGLCWPRRKEEGEAPSAKTMEALRSIVDAVLEHGDES